MKTRRIEGTDIQAALREVRRTLGPDAVIVSTRETEEGIEIVAAPSPSEPPRRRREVAAASVHPIGQAARRVSSVGGFARLAAGIARPLSSAQRGPSLDAQLDTLGLSRDVRDALVAAASERAADDPGADPLEIACAVLAAGLKVEGPALMRDGGRVAVVGTTGVGKTTTIAKLAAHFARRHGPGSVALVNADHYRIGASEQLHRFATLLGTPVFDVTGRQELQACLDKLSGRRLVLVDTAGMAPGDVRFEEQRALLGDSGMECYLALSLNTQTAVLARTVQSYEGLPLRGCILTKEDEAVNLGAGLSMAVRHRLPVGFVTTGPRVPVDIRHAEATKLVARARALAAREDVGFSVRSDAPQAEVVR